MHFLQERPRAAVSVIPVTGPQHGCSAQSSPKQLGFEAGNPETRGNTEIPQKTFEGLPPRARRATLTRFFLLLQIVLILTQNSACSINMTHIFLSSEWIWSGSESDVDLSWQFQFGLAKTWGVSMFLALDEDLKFLSYTLNMTRISVLKWMTCRILSLFLTKF